MAINNYPTQGMRLIPNNQSNEPRGERKEGERKYSQKRYLQRIDQGAGETVQSISLESFSASWGWLPWAPLPLRLLRRSSR